MIVMALAGTVITQRQYAALFSQVTDNGAALVSTLALAGSGIGKLEFVDVTIDSNHTEVGDLEILLTSPSGTRSTLSVVRECIDAQQAAVPCGATLAGGFRFGVVRLMDERADGTWTLSVRDGRAGGTGALVSWSIKAYGT